MAHQEEQKQEQEQEQEHHHEHGHEHEHDHDHDEEAHMQHTSVNPSSSSPPAPYQFEFRPLLKFAFVCIRANAAPGLVLQMIALMLVLLYYSSSAAQHAFDGVASAKDSLGLGFSPLVNTFAGGVFPGLIIAARERRAGIDNTNRTPTMLKEIIFLSAFWCYKGVEVDLFYQLQAKMFGTAQSFAVIAPKVLFDQFVYNPVWGTVSCVVPYLWKDCDFSFALTWQRMDKKLWLFQMPATQLQIWFIWFPTVCLIYAMPSSLQIPLFAIVLCFWSVVLAFSQSSKNIPSDPSSSTAPAPAPASAASASRSLAHADGDAHDLELAALSSEISNTQSNLAIKANLNSKQSTLQT